MEILILLLDELDDIFSPLFAMLWSLDGWRLATVAGAAGISISLNSPIMLAAGLLLASAGEAAPARRAGLTGHLTAE